MTATGILLDAFEAALTPDETALMDRAIAQLLRVLADAFPWPADSGGIKVCLAGLHESLADFNGLRDRTVHPATLFFDLAAGHPDGALAEAMERVAQDIADWTGALNSLAGEAEAAAFVSGEDKGGQ